MRSLYNTAGGSTHHSTIYRIVRTLNGDRIRAAKSIRTTEDVAGD
jgi:hypothetical protein